MHAHRHACPTPYQRGTRRPSRQGPTSRPRRATRGGAASPSFSPAALTGGLTELAWVGAHALLPLGTRTEQLRPTPASGRAPSPRGCGPSSPTTPWPPTSPWSWCTAWSTTAQSSPSCAGASAGAASPRVCSWNYSPLLAGRCRARRGRLGGHIERICTGDRARPGARGGAQPRRPGRPVPGAAAGWRPADRLAGHPGHPARGRGEGPRAPDAPGAPAPARVGAGPGAGRARAPSCRDTGHLRSTATSTRRSSPRRPAAASTPDLQAPATCWCGAWGTCRCPSTGASSTRWQPDPGRGAGDTHPDSRRPRQA